MNFIRTNTRIASPFGAGWVSKVNKFYITVHAQIAKDTHSREMSKKRVRGDQFIDFDFLYNE
jgi:hypothetical protein